MTVAAAPHCAAPEPRSPARKASQSQHPKVSGRGSRPRQFCDLIRLPAVEKQEIRAGYGVVTRAADSETSFDLDRSQKSRLAITLLIAVFLAVILAVVLVGPVMSLFGLQAIGA